MKILCETLDVFLLSPVPGLQHLHLVTRIATRRRFTATDKAVGGPLLWLQKISWWRCKRLTSGEACSVDGQHVTWIR